MQAWHALSGLIAQMKTAPSFFLRAAVAKITTTGLAGGLLCPCKGLNAGMGLTRPFEIRSSTAPISLA